MAAKLRIGRKTAIFLLCPSPAVYSTVFARNFTPNPDFWEHVSLPWVRFRAGVLGWSWVGVQLKGRGGWIRPQNPGLVQISEPTVSELCDLAYGFAYTPYVFLGIFLIVFSVIWLHCSNHTPSFPGPFQASARHWERGYFEQSKMAAGVHWSLVDKSIYFTTFRRTARLKVPYSTNNVHRFQIVEFMAWLKNGRPAQVEEMTRQPEATRIRVSMHRGDMETCRIQPRAGATNGWISRWVDDHKPWRIWFMDVSPTSVVSVQFANVLGRVVNVYYLGYSVSQDAKNIFPSL